MLAGVRQRFVLHHFGVPLQPRLLHLPFLSHGMGQWFSRSVRMACCEAGAAGARLAFATSCTSMSMNVGQLQSGTDTAGVRCQQSDSLVIKSSDGLQLYLINCCGFGNH
ncbi:hypothetical protein RRG08_007553 [Elysia crispata]|uniref:Uncharacterized protein n=1 Tax=Elysia crispata TaxID=231223 RepID=A0AAE0YFN9_9GAST|nr:hypothetical protein RRG08_007553 [Elysia crispata]